jgi:hypothetical protein
MKFCVRCGSNERYLGGDCKQCARVLSAKRYAVRRVEILARQTIYRANNPEKVRASSDAWVMRNRERVRTNQARWRAANPEATKENKRMWHKAHREELNTRQAIWQKAHSGKCSAWCRKRQAAKLQATPAWANDFFIEEIYDLAQLRTKATGFKWHVDHTVPLRSKLVCGLHCEANLQVIPASINSSKGNRYWPDMPEGDQPCQYQI